MLSQSLLLQSDNLVGLKYLLHEKALRGKIDLIYIDPPFATGINFSVLNGRAATISAAKNGDIAYSDKLKGDEYLSFLKERLLLLRELLSAQGSIYLHIDYKIGHYVKVLMDEVFGFQNFRNDITRIKCNPKNFKKIGYGNVKDLILFYTKSANAIWNEPYQDYSKEDVLRLFPKISADGRRYTTVPLHAPGETENGDSGKAFKGIMPPVGRHWRRDIATLEAWDRMGLIEWSKTGNPRKIIYADEQQGKRMQDIWEFKDPQYPEYPTEKNLKLLELIVKTSSNEDSIVLDCFCGSGTTLIAAQNLNRNWIGIDQSEAAIAATKKKLDAVEKDLFYEASGYEHLILPGKSALQDKARVLDKQALSEDLFGLKEPTAKRLVR
ncbi:MAG: site-specific DNA-methyltransferase [Candidatus Cloacimonetes bacterium]|nr:site-specific DNA-methyltransferase [Candidatus Cloacimonadota bacterium]